jgi:hypothetical protein
MFRIAKTFRSWNDFKICDLEFLKPKLNRKQKVQECDVRMLKRITKARYTKKENRKVKNEKSTEEILNISSSILNRNGSAIKR